MQQPLLEEDECGRHSGRQLLWARASFIAVLTAVAGASIFLIPGPSPTVRAGELELTSKLPSVASKVLALQASLVAYSLGDGPSGNSTVRAMVNDAAGVAGGMNSKFVKEAAKSQGWDQLLEADYRLVREAADGVNTFTWQSGGKLIVSIRGTDTFSDLEADAGLYPLAFSHQDFEPGGAFFHAPNLYPSYIKTVQAEVQWAKTKGRVLVTGHSMGGALAIIAGANLGGVEVVAYAAAPYASQVAPMAAASMAVIYTNIDAVFLLTQAVGGFAGAVPCVLRVNSLPGCDACLADVKSKIKSKGSFPALDCILPGGCGASPCNQGFLPGHSGSYALLTPNEIAC